MMLGQLTEPPGTAVLSVAVQLSRKLRSLPNEPHPLIASGGSAQKGDPDGNPGISSMAQSYCVEVAEANRLLSPVVASVGYDFSVKPAVPSSACPLRSQYLSPAPGCTKN